MNHVENLALLFTDWINSPANLPENFSLANDCQLFALDDEKKKVNCKGYEMPADEVLSLLSQGLAPSEISLNWNEHIQFTLTQDSLIKRIKCLDYLTDEFNELRSLDEEYQQQDAALTLLTGELRALTNALFSILEKKQSEVTATEAVTVQQVAQVCE